MKASLFKDELEMFPTDLPGILQRVERIDPVRYGKTRNYLKGAVTHLSPYISRGVISTRYVLNEVLRRGFIPDQIEKFIQELAWRDYFQQVWIAKGEDIDRDLRNKQAPVSHHGIPRSIVEARTGIEAVDRAILEFYETGYMHNHMRMYLASIACNVGRSHWNLPARWMYFHLLDADWASNALSWQWVAGANSHKKYFANQENINKYCSSRQRGTFLDRSYEEFDSLEIPKELLESQELRIETSLPAAGDINIDSSLPTFIYNFYNLDPLWHKGIPGNRILLLEPSVFKRYPISGKSVEFMLNLAGNIEGIQVFSGEFDELLIHFGPDRHENIYYKEHPLNSNYQGMEEPRDWMFEVKGYYPSFFAFWKRCRKELSFQHP